MRTVSIAIVALSAWMASEAAASPAPAMQNIRPRDATANLLLQFGSERSATFRQLVREVERSRLTAILAHELRHALEASEAASMRTVLEFGVYFRQIGADDHDLLDTLAARESGTVVEDELRGLDTDPDPHDATPTRVACGADQRTRTSDRGKASPDVSAEDGGIEN